MEKLISIPELFKKSFELYRSRMWTMLFLGLIGWLASIVILAVFGATGFLTLFVGRGVLTFSLLTALVFLVGLLLIIIANLWIQVALIYALKEEYTNKGLRDLLLAVRNKIAPYFWVSFLHGIVVLLGFILFIIPGIIFCIWFSLSQYAFVFEDARGMKALSRSRELTKGYWWAIVGRLLLLGIVAILISSISKLGFLLNSLFTAPFGIVYLYVIYEDLKKIKSV